MAEKPEVKVAWFKRSAVWRRIAADVGALAVGGNAAYLSWGHIVATSILLHQDQGAAWLYPVSIDGMMVVGVVKAADDRVSGRKVRWWARVATWLGGGLSIQAQIMSAYAYGALAAAWAVVPSVTLIVVVEVQSRRGKLIVEREPVTVPEAVTPVPAVSPAVEPVEPVPVAPVTVTPVQEPDPEPIIAELVPVPAPRRPRRRQSVKGHAGTGATDAQLDVAFEALADRANGRVSDPAAIFVEPS